MTIDQQIEEIAKRMYVAHSREHAKQYMTLITPWEDLGSHAKACWIAAANAALDELADLGNNILPEFFKKTPPQPQKCSCHNCKAAEKRKTGWGEH